MNSDAQILDPADVDGFRCDVRLRSAVLDSWEQARARLKQIKRKSSCWRRASKPELLVKAFDLLFWPL